MDPSPPTEPMRFLDVPLVGRVAEMEAVLGVVGTGARDLARVVLVAGEPGAGKSRLAREIVEKAPCRSVWSACWDGDEAPPFWPWIQVVRALRRDHAGGNHPGGGGSLDELLGIDPVGAAREARFQLFDAFADELAAAMSGDPLLVVIDDLQWADPGSRLLLRFLSVDGRTGGLTVVGAYRDDPGGPGGSIAADAPDLCRNGVHLRLEGLGEAGVAELCDHLGGDHVDEAALHRRSGGNPFFIREFVRLGAPARASVPTTVEALVALRLETASSATRTVLDGAAILGSSFDVAVLAALLGNDPADVLDALDDARAAGLVAPVGGGWFEFGHSVVQEVLYARIRPGDQVRLHARAAAILEDRSAGGSPLGIAHHRRLGTLGPDPSAAHWAEKAAEWSFETLAYEQSATWYGHALALVVPGADPGHEAELLIRRGEASLAAGDPAGGRDAFRQAAAVARGCRSTPLLAQAALAWGSGQGGFEVPLHDATQVALLDEALAAVGSGPSALRARLLARLSVALSGSEDDHLRQTLSEEAIVAARAVDDGAALGHALAAHCDAIAGPDHCEQRRDEGGEIADLARRLGDRPLALLGRRLRAVALLEMGEIAAFDVEVARFADLAGELKQPMYDWYVPLWLASRALMRGEIEAAASANEAAREIGQRVESMNALALTFTQWWVGERMQGRAAASSAEMRSVLGFDPGAQPLVSGEVAGRLRAVIATQLGDTAGAHAQLEVLVAAGLGGRPRDSEWLPEMAQLAEVAVFTGHRVAVAQLYDLLSPYAHRFCVEGIGAAFTGSVHWYLAMLAGASGDRDSATSHEGQADDAHRRVGLVGRPPPIAPTVEATAAVTPRVPPPSSDRGGALVSEGATWAVTFAGTTRRLRDSKGVRDLAVLLRTPHREVHCLELAGGIDLGGDAGPALDDEARTSYQQRIRDLHEDIEDARAANDLVRAERSEAELDALVEQLSQAFGLSGRSRPQGAAAERARTTVTSRLRAAIRQAGELHPDLGHHLQHSVRTGTWCVYAPEHDVDWQVRTEF